MLPYSVLPVCDLCQQYYSAQVLEPAVRGFLGILEKQFPRSDLYVWELLQNAVDDGAMHVVLEPNSHGTGMCFTHNGRQFTALDVLGLCSVGLSTKAISGKRSIGRRRRRRRGVGIESRTVACEGSCAPSARHS